MMGEKEDSENKEAKSSRKQDRNKRLRSQSGRSLAQPLDTHLNWGWLSYALPVKDHPHADPASCRLPQHRSRWPGSTQGERLGDGKEKLRYGDKSTAHVHCRVPPHQDEDGRYIAALAVPSRQ